MTAPKPCPFCGSKKVRQSSYPQGDYSKTKGEWEYWSANVKCDKCRAAACEDAFSAQSQSLAKQIALAAWNRRAKV